MSQPTSQPVQWGTPGARVADHPLNFMLQMAVPLHIVALQEQGGPTAEDFQSLAELDDILARADDLLLYVGPNTKQGEVAAAFNKLARGLAVMSFIPSGVPFGGEEYSAVTFDDIVCSFVQERIPEGEDAEEEEDGQV